MSQTFKQQRYYFGDKWSAPITDGAIKGPSAVGKQCQLCTETISETDSGMYQNTFKKTGETSHEYISSPTHKECLMRAVMGGPDCASGTCLGPGSPHEHDQLTYRQQALKTWDLITKTGR